MVQYYGYICEYNYDRLIRYGNEGIVSKNVQKSVLREEYV